MRRGPEGVDTRDVRHASRLVGLQITIASGALVVVALGIAYLFVLDQLRPAELKEPPAPGEHKIYIDTTEAFIALAVAGILAVAVAGVLSMMVTRRAVRPLARALRLQRDFVADASHELRTPLAILDARLQIMQRDLRPEDPNVHTVDELRADTHTLIDIVDDLLIAADPEREQPGGAVRLSAPIGRAVESLQVLAREADVTVTLDGDDVSAFVPATSIQRCATALIDNALTHSPAGSIVSVSVRRDGRSAVLTVADHGPGIQGIDPDRVFDRFARASSPPGGQGRTSFGIGLSLVRDVAMRHGGDVRVTSTSRAGTVLEMRLPAAPTGAR